MERKKKYLQQISQQQEVSTATRVWPAVCLQSVEAVLPEPIHRFEHCTDLHTDQLKDKQKISLGF